MERGEANETRIAWDPPHANEERDLAYLRGLCSSRAFAEQHADAHVLACGVSVIVSSQNGRHTFEFFYATPQQSTYANKLTAQLAKEGHVCVGRGIHRPEREVTAQPLRMHLADGVPSSANFDQEDLQSLTVFANAPAVGEPMSVDLPSGFGLKVDSDQNRNRFILTCGAERADEAQALVRAFKATFACAVMVVVQPPTQRNEVGAPRVAEQAEEAEMTGLVAPAATSKGVEAPDPLVLQKDMARLKKAVSKLPVGHARDIQLDCGCRAVISRPGSEVSIHLYGRSGHETFMNDVLEQARKEGWGTGFLDICAHDSNVVKDKSWRGSVSMFKEDDERKRNAQAEHCIRVLRNVGLRMTPTWGSSVRNALFGSGRARSEERTPQAETLPSNLPYAHGSREGAIKHLQTSVEALKPGESWSASDFPLPGVEVAVHRASRGQKGRVSFFASPGQAQIVESFRWKVEARLGCRTYLHVVDDREEARPQETWERDVLEQRLAAIPTEGRHVTSFVMSNGMVIHVDAQGNHKRLIIHAEKGSEGRATELRESLLQGACDECEVNVVYSSPDVWAAAVPSKIHRVRERDGGIAADPRDLDALAGASDTGSTEDFGKQFPLPSGAGHFVIDSNGSMNALTIFPTSGREDEVFALVRAFKAEHPHPVRVHFAKPPVSPAG